VLKRAKCFHEICEKIPVRIGPRRSSWAPSLPVQGRGPVPENGLEWLIGEAESGLISTRPLDPYYFEEEDKKYFLETRATGPRSA
jgi:hypothetical protein